MWHRRPIFWLWLAGILVLTLPILYVFFDWTSFLVRNEYARKIGDMKATVAEIQKNRQMTTEEDFADLHPQLYELSHPGVSLRVTFHSLSDRFDIVYAEDNDALRYASKAQNEGRTIWKMDDEGWYLIRDHHLLLEILNIEIF